MCERRFCKKKILVSGAIPLAARSHRFFGNTLLKAGLLMRLSAAELVCRLGGATVVWRLPQLRS